MKSIFKSLALVMGLCLSAQSLALNEEQKDELKTKGTITIKDEDGQVKGHFHVKFMLGTDNIKAAMEKVWHRMEKLAKDLVDEEHFWKDKMYSRFREGVKAMKHGWSEGVCRIPDQFHATMDANAKVEGIAADFVKFGNWLKFCGTCFGDVCITAYGTIAGGAWAIAAPTATLLYRPVAIAFDGFFGELVFPALAYSFNEIGYLLIKGKPEPKAGDVTVTWVPNFNYKEHAAEIQEVFASAAPQANTDL